VRNLEPRYESLKQRDELIFATLYLVAELQNRWLGFAVCGVGLAWLLILLRREARR